LKIKKGDEVTAPSFTFIAMANAVLFQGAKPVFADVDERTFNKYQSQRCLRESKRQTKAIIAVHLFGHIAS